MFTILFCFLILAGRLGSDSSPAATLPLRRPGPPPRPGTMRTTPTSAPSSTCSPPRPTGSVPPPRFAPYLGPDVLEVGAGFGGTTRPPCRGDHGAWTCLEPDAGPGRAAGRVDRARATLPACCRVEVGTLAGLPAGPVTTRSLHRRPRAHRGRPHGVGPRGRGG